MKRLLPILAPLLALALASCASGASRQEPQRPPQITAKQSVPQKTPEKPGAELDESAFEKLPLEAKRYLIEIARAFANRDGAFLNAQGEPDYERRIRPRFDDARYAALLYRIGPFAKERPNAAERMPTIDIASLKGIRFTGWREIGPIIEIRGKIRYRTGKEDDCLLALLWKTDPPRLLGIEP